MANGERNGTGITWVDGAVRLVGTLGFPVVVAGLLLWWVLFRFEQHMPTRAAAVRELLKRGLAAKDPDGR